MEGSGAQERHIVRSTLAQQVAQVYGVLAMLAVITLLGRTLPLNEFGLYGLLLSTTIYVQLLQTSVSAAAMRAIAGALDREASDRAYSVAVALYAVAGVVAGVLVALTAVVLAAVLDLSPELRVQAREAGIALGIATAVGWPAKAFQDVLRGVQRFAAASLAEIAANTVLVVAIVGLVQLDAPLWAVIAVGGSLQILVGFACGLVMLVTGGLPRFRRSLITRTSVRALLGTSALLGSIGVADVVINTLDRIILAGFRSTATVGLYEGAARPHALVRQLHGTLALTVLPVASGFIARGDEERLHDLLVRGTRYVMAVVVPVTVVLMVLSDRILEVWLGPEFVVAAPAMAILVSYWLANSATGVGGGMLVAAGQLRELNLYAWIVAGANLVLSLALTPLIGLDGVVIGTTVPYVAITPWFIALMLREFPVTLERFLRVACLPAYATGGLVAACAGLARALFALDTVGAVAVATLAALVIGWVAYAVFWMGPAERRMVRQVMRRRVAAA